MKDIYGIDTNVLIYYLTGKPERKHKECLALIKKAEKGKLTIKVVPVIYWEATWILEKFYKNSKDKIVNILTMFLPDLIFHHNIICKELEFLLKDLLEDRLKLLQI